MTQRRLGGKARLARMDMPPAFRRQAAQVEHRDLDVGRSGEHFACDFEKAIGFRHLAGMMLLPGLARTAQGSQDRQGARSLSVRTARQLPWSIPCTGLVGIINRDENP
jgi:hypothetical protein